MPRQHRRHSTTFKRQVVEEYHAGGTLHGLSKQHDICRNLIRVWIEKYDAGQYDEDAEAAETVLERDARIAALERLVGRQALEIEFLKGAAKTARSPKNASTSVITGPKASPSNGGAN
jgi:transposase-like protein